MNYVNGQPPTGCRGIRRDLEATPQAEALRSCWWLVPCPWKQRFIIPKDGLSTFLGRQLPATDESLFVNQENADRNVGKSRNAGSKAWRRATRKWTEGRKPRERARSHAGGTPATGVPAPSSSPHVHGPEPPRAGAPASGKAALTSQSPFLPRSRLQAPSPRLPWLSPRWPPPTAARGTAPPAVVCSAFQRQVLPPLVCQYPVRE